jgi:alpha-L-fucosidase
MATYSNTSPYFSTKQNNISLDVFSPRTITAESDDVEFEIERTYAYRPDLLAFDLYGSPRLWWVFAQRNPDTIEDPIYDFAPGTKIKLPKYSNLTKDLGI